MTVWCHCGAWKSANSPSSTIVCSYVRLQQNGSGVVGIDLFTPLGTLTFYNDVTQLITSWDVYSNIG